MEKEEFLVKVEEEVYGPIPLDRIINDVKNGELTKEATFFDDDDWIPVSLLLEEKAPIKPWNEDNWIDKKEDLLPEDGPPLPASSAWEDVNRKGRWLMIYGDHLVIDGGGFRKEDIGSLLTGEPREGGIPIPKILNVSVTKYENHSKIEVSSFHKMYEVYTLVCNLTNDDTDSLVKELNNSDVRISFS